MRVLVLVFLFMLSPFVHAGECTDLIQWAQTLRPGVSAPMIEFACHQAVEHRLPPRVVVSVMFVESSFRPIIHSDTSYGVMQINTKVHPKLIAMMQRRYHLWWIYNWRLNIAIGTALLARLVSESPNMATALQRYNGTFANWHYSWRVLYLSQQFGRWQAHAHPIATLLQRLNRQGAGLML